MPMFAPRPFRPVRFLVGLAATLAWALGLAPGPAAAQSRALPLVPQVQLPTGAPPSMDVRLEITRQGLVEAMELQRQLLDGGGLGPRGHVDNCAALASTAREFLGQTNTLTGTYLAAGWLEYWGVACAPRLRTLWTRADRRRIHAATQRARLAWPDTWPTLGPGYLPGPMEDYLRAVNRRASLAVPGRACARRALSGFAAGKASWPATDFAIQTCPPTHAPLIQRAALKRYADLPLTTVLATDFLGLSRWVIDPQTLAQALARPDARPALLKEMADLAPGLPVLLQRQVLLATPEVSAQMATHAQVLVVEVKTMEQGMAAIPGDWASPEACRKALALFSGFLGRLTHPASLQIALASAVTTSARCPSQATWLDPAQVDAAVARTARMLGSSPQARILSRPMAQVLARQQAAILFPQRRRCLSATLAAAHARGETFEEGRRQARGACPAAYQAQWAPATRGAR